ncbi:hypothetical protein ACJX0J_030331, partial [Zea mays]
YVSILIGLVISTYFPSFEKEKKKQMSGGIGWKNILSIIIHKNQKSRKPTVALLETPSEAQPHVYKNSKYNKYANKRISSV